MEPSAITSQRPAKWLIISPIIPYPQEVKPGLSRAFFNRAPGNRTGNPCRIDGNRSSLRDPRSFSPTRRLAGRWKLPGTGTPKRAGVATISPPTFGREIPPIWGENNQQMRKSNFLPDHCYIQGIPEKHW